VIHRGARLRLALLKTGMRCHNYRAIIIAMIIAKSSKPWPRAMIMIVMPPRVRYQLVVFAVHYPRGTV